MTLHPQPLKESLKENLSKGKKEKNHIEWSPLSKNSHLSQKMRSFLNKVVLKNKTHAYWLNTLSFLEHIGSRKIVKSQNSHSLSFTLLEHIAEESRHAYFFKKLAQKLVEEKTCPNFEEKFMLNGKEGEKYFQQLDRSVETNLKSSDSERSKVILFLNYLYTTWLVERRALWLYEIYSDILKEKKFSFHLKPVLVDEDKHLETVEKELRNKDPHFNKRGTYFSSLEEEKFDIFLESLLSSPLIQDV